MEDAQIYALVDHTLLSPTATLAEIFALCNEAQLHKTASVCIPPAYVRPVKEKYGDALTICTVVGFPLGYNISQIKVEEARQALAEGATEIDVVINQADVKNKAYEKITAELTALKKACGPHILKVIIECCYLSQEEKIALCKCVTESGADYIKTSTGFGTGGATLEDIRLFKAHIGPGVKMKAAGGMRTREDFIAFINEGCLRLGTSAAVKVLSGSGSGTSY